jgi:superfamily I DNA and/or RNA helicase
MVIKDTFIIVKGQPKSLQIEKMDLGQNGLYAIKFKNTPKTFHYRYNDVVYLKDATWHDNLNCKVYIGGCEQHNIADIRSFKQGNLRHWRITFSNGFVKDYLDGSINVVESCFSDKVAKDTFNYLKRIAYVNELGKDEEHGGILSALYEKIDFIDDTAAVAPYLNPSKNKVRKCKSHNLIFPFGCNASQEKAVTAAFENQISVIQGPPGTGKTQTILNIIANIIIQGKSVIVVSNNNSATENVLEKLDKFGLAFVVASLGKRENKDAFIKKQPGIPDELHSWRMPSKEVIQAKLELSSILAKLKKVFALQEELASCKQEIKSVTLEWEHFMKNYNIGANSYTPKHGIKSKRLMKLWLEYQAYAEGDVIVPLNFFGKLKERIKWSWMNITRKYLLGINSPFDINNLQSTILELQSLYYVVRLQELNSIVGKIEKDLKIIDSEDLSKILVSKSLQLLKDTLCCKYDKEKRYVLSSVNEINMLGDKFCKQYPVILSTTFSARTAISDHVYDYIIMDEASQVSIDTGALALTCAKNAVIVGDTMQLPNVVTEEDRFKLNGIFEEYNIERGYHCADYSFLQSICAIIPNVKQTLLREHYRCHPTIINFCNQRFYGGNLLIMTKDHDEKDVMMAIKTVPGHHARNHYNQREIDVVKEEVLPIYKNSEEIGVITPYNNQVNEFIRQIPGIETATIHKYQGREKDTIIMSVVDDQITEFSDDPNLINVAISRAKKHFCLIVSGNEQKRKGYIAELIDYIVYNNLSVTESKICSIFDYLFSHYSSERMEYLAKHKNISLYDSENLTYSLLENILSDYPEFSHLGILCHTPLRTIFKDWSLLNEEEKKYISHYSTHLDFLVVNHVTKKPVLAIETDGYAYHNKETEQYQRDLKKNHILELYGLPIIRLRTNESGEKEKILLKLREIVN